MKELAGRIFLVYLRLAAKLQLLKIAPREIVGITGSAGKSSCREAVTVVLSSKYKVKQSSGGNSETGLPLDILGFGEEHNYSTKYWLSVLVGVPWKLLTNWEKYDVYVAEMGVDSPKEPKNMSYLLRFLRPTRGVFLNVLPVHTEYYPQKTKEELVTAIAKEKGKLITSLPSSGTAVLNADDPNSVGFRNQTKASVITFGNKGEIKPFLIEIPGYVLTTDYGHTLAAAVAVGQSLGISEQEAKENLIKNFKLPPGRMSVFKGIKGSTIIDSSYNASKQPVLAALQVLAKYPGKRKIAVLGDMRELGALSESEHQEAAKEAVRDADIIFTFGPLTEKYFPDDKTIRKFRTMSKLLSGVKEEIQKGDVILVKGSQNTILLETLIEEILEDKSDTNKLCRRGEFWELKRQELLKREI